MSTNSSRPHKTCPKCGESFPATTEFFNANKKRPDGLNVWCKGCLKAWRLANRESLLEKKRAYHREKMNDAEYKRKRKESNKRYRAKNRQQIYEYNRQYRLSNRERRREYNWKFRLHNPEKVLQYNFKQRTLRAKNNCAFSEQDWQKALTYFNHCCAVCGCLPDTRRTIAGDHWIPLSNKGSPGTVPTNIIPLCHGRKGCNNSKHDKMPEIWLMETFGEDKAKEILTRINAYFEWVNSRED